MSNELKLQKSYSCLTEYSTDKTKEAKEHVIEFLDELKYQVSSLVSDNVGVLYNCILADEKGIEEFSKVYSNADSIESSIRKTITYVCEQFENSSIEWNTQIDWLEYLERIQDNLNAFCEFIDDAKFLCNDHMNKISNLTNDILLLAPQILESTRVLGDGIILQLNSLACTLEDYKEHVRISIAEPTEEEEERWEMERPYTLGETITHDLVEYMKAS